MYTLILLCALVSAYWCYPDHNYNFEMPRSYVLQHHIVLQQYQSNEICDAANSVLWLLVPQGVHTTIIAHWLVAALHTTDVYHTMYNRRCVYHWFVMHSAQVLLLYAFVVLLLLIRSCIFLVSQHKQYYCLLHMVVLSCYCCSWSVVVTTHAL